MANYKIKSGDTLSGIAKKHGTTVSALMSANPDIKNANVIYAGKTLVLPGSSVKSSSAKTSTTKKTTSKTTTPKGLLTFKPQTDADFRRIATDRLSPLYNAEREAYKQTTERETQALKQQKDSRQRTYADQKEELGEFYDEERQRASDDVLKRGLARSTIATDMQSKVGQLEGKALTKLQKDLQADLSQIDQQITTLQSQLAQSLKRLDIDKATKIKSTIDELRKEHDATKRQIQQYNNQYLAQKRKEQLEREQFSWQKKMQQAQLNIERERLALQKKQAAEAAAARRAAQAAAARKAAAAKQPAMTSRQQAHYNDLWNWYTGKRWKNKPTEALTWLAGGGKRAAQSVLGVSGYNKFIKDLTNYANYQMSAFNPFTAGR